MEPDSEKLEFVRGMPESIICRGKNAVHTAIPVTLHESKSKRSRRGVCSICQTVYFAGSSSHQVLPVGEALAPNANGKRFVLLDLDDAVAVWCEWGHTKSIKTVLAKATSESKFRSGKCSGCGKTYLSRISPPKPET